MYSNVDDIFALYTEPFTEYTLHELDRIYYTENSITITTPGNRSHTILFDKNKEFISTYIIYAPSVIGTRTKLVLEYTIDTRYNHSVKFIRNREYI